MASVYVCFELSRKDQRETVIAIYETEKPADDWAKEEPRDRRYVPFEVLTTLEESRRAKALAKLTKEDREALGVGEYESARRAAPIPTTPVAAPQKRGTPAR